jgi:hypothetical protein
LLRPWGRFDRFPPETMLVTTKTKKKKKKKKTKVMA